MCLAHHHYHREQNAINLGKKSGQILNFEWSKLASGYWLTQDMGVWVPFGHRMIGSFLWQPLGLLLMTHNQKVSIIGMIDSTMEATK